MSKISIVLAVYNGEKYIIEQLKSLSSQTRKLDEVYILDDNSTDKTVDVIEEYININGLWCWKIVQNEKNIGWKRNFKNGIDLCTGDYIFLCDQDDIWNTNKIEIMASILENNMEIGLLVSNYEIFISDKDQGSTTYMKSVSKMVNDGSLQRIEYDKKWCYVGRPGCTFAFTKSFYTSIKGEWNVELAHDAQLWRKAYIRKKLYRVNKSLIKFRRHGDNATSTRNINLAERINGTEWFQYYYKEALKYIQEFRTDDVEELLNIKKGQEFLKTRKEMLYKRDILKWIYIFIFYRSYYLTYRGCFVDLYCILKG